MTGLKKYAAALGLTLASAMGALAAPLSEGSSIGWSGAYRAEDSSGNAATLGSATFIDFAPADTGSGSIVVLTSTGDLSGIPFLTGGTTKDFSINPFVPVASFLTIPNAIDPLFSIDLNTLQINTQNNAGIVLLGLATLSLDGYDPTPGTYSLSFQTAGNDLGTPTPYFNFTFSANSVATAVPEPGSLALVGVALAGLAAARRTGRRKH